jgi:hypothetical protein
MLYGMPRLHQRRAEARGRRQGQGPDLAIRQLPQKRLQGEVWLVVFTILKNISQWEGLSHILWKIKDMFETTNQIN